MTNSLKTLQNQFIDFLQSKGRTHATILAYGKDIEQLLGNLDENDVNNIKSVTTSDLEKFISSLGKTNYTPKTISRKINSIKTFYRFLIDQKIVEENPSLPITHPKYETKPPRILSKTEYRALRDSCRQDTRTYGVVELLLQTGIRIGELARITLEDIGQRNLIIKAFESHAQRKIPLNKSAKKAIELYLAIRPKSKDQTLFITKTGRPLLVRNIRTTIERYFKIAGIKNAKVNDLRHTFIAEQLTSGTSLVVVSKIVGHKRLSTTEKYLELIKDKVEEKTKLEEL